MKKLFKSIHQIEISRYIINGLLATGIHYAVLTFNIEIISMRSAGLANFTAAIFGISASFMGSRYYVFKKHKATISKQAFMFVVLYASIAVLHGIVLYCWSDIYGFDYRIGFIIATCFQVLFSYFGNKFLVFKE